MPNNKAKIKFDFVLMMRCDDGIEAIRKIFIAILPKYRAGRMADRELIVKTFLKIKQYTYLNIGTIPLRDDQSELKHDQKNLVKLRNAKEALKRCFNTAAPTRQKEIKREYAAALDLLNQFQTYLEGVLNAKKE